MFFIPEESPIDEFEEPRRSMIEYQLRRRGITDEQVLAVMNAIGREEFVGQKYRSQAYADGPLPIGSGQTISQPYIVALMTQELKLERDCEVLEVGTGSGYQTAILARLTGRVYTCERYGQLSERAQAILARLDVENVQYFIGDGSCGWPEAKKFDRILLTAAVPGVADSLLAQLADGGLLVGPVGGAFSQELVVVRKDSGKISEKQICPVRFVKMIGKCGFKE